MTDKIESLIRRMRWKARCFGSNNTGTGNNDSPNFHFQFK